MTAATAGQITRLAPSPTGSLHLGNARTFIINWLLARRGNARIVLRIEDLDSPRTKKGADIQALEDLRWLGLDWDEGPIYQSGRAALYGRAVEKLLAEGAAYYCTCSRREAATAASAPHAADGAAVYPGTCRGRFNSREEALAASNSRPPVVRFQLSGQRLVIDDLFLGQTTFDHPAETLGDFVIAKAEGTAAYQLATALDDALMGITLVVRGDDLLDSTPRQFRLLEALGRAVEVPRYAHLPLVLGPDGLRLAKRHGDSRLAHYRAQGVSSGRIRALLARWSGLDAGDELSLEQWLEHFELSQMPHAAITFTPADERWLLSKR